MPRLQAMLGDDARVRDRMGERLHLPVPAHAHVSPWPRAVRRRRGASRLAVRRARRQQRRPGRRQPGLEARAGARRAGAASAARHLRRRARARRRREHPQLDPRAPTSSRRRATSAATFRDAVLALASAIRSRARWSTAAACRCRRCSADRRSTRRDSTATRFGAAMAPGTCAADAPVPRPRGDWLLASPRGRLHAACVRHADSRGCDRGAGQRRQSVAACCESLPSETAIPACRTVVGSRRACSPQRYDAQAGHLLPVPPRPARLRALARASISRRVRAAIARASGERRRRRTATQEAAHDCSTANRISRRPTTSTRS